MKVAFLFAFLAAASAQITSRVINLPLDHFNPLERRTFDARYFVNSEHYLPYGPIFIYVGDNAVTSNILLRRGAVSEIARDTRGILFSLENRYYGESRPTPDTSVPNLRWLTIDQTLADLATFINFIRANYYRAENSKVILWGSGFSASLAVWARQKYPHLVSGVWASSAHLDARFEYPQFMRNAFYTINSIGGPECGQIITNAMRMIEDGIRTRNTSYVEERFRLCSPIDVDVEENIQRLFYGIGADIGLSFVTHSRYDEIDLKCSIMRALEEPENPPQDDLDAFARWFIDEFHRNLECLDYDDASVMARYQNVEWGSISTVAGRRQTLWLQCTQLGQFAIANEGLNHPFGWRFDSAFFRRWCSQVFEESLFSDGFMEHSISQTNTYYGGVRPYVYRVLFTNGEMDPRKNLGVLEDLNSESPAILMSLQSFSRDLGSPSSTDYVVLLETKETARNLILQWILDDSQFPTTIGTTTTNTPEPAFDREPAFNFKNQAV